MGVSFWVTSLNVGCSFGFHFKQPKASSPQTPQDEDLLDECGLCVHPLVGTATYLTDAGCLLEAGWVCGSVQAGELENLKIAQFSEQFPSLLLNTA